MKLILINLFERLDPSIYVVYNFQLFNCTNHSSLKRIQRSSRIVRQQQRERGIRSCDCHRASLVTSSIDATGFNKRHNGNETVKYPRLE